MTAGEHVVFDVLCVIISVLIFKKIHACTYALYSNFLLLAV